MQRQECRFTSSVQPFTKGKHIVSNEQHALARQEEDTQDFQA